MAVVPWTSSSLHQASKTLARCIVGFIPAPASPEPNLRESPRPSDKKKLPFSASGAEAGACRMLPDRERGRRENSDGQHTAAGRKRLPYRRKAPLSVEAERGVKGRGDAATTLNRHATRSDRAGTRMRPRAVGSRLGLCGARGAVWCGSKALIALEEKSVGRRDRERARARARASHGAHGHVGQQILETSHVRHEADVVR